MIRLNIDGLEVTGFEGQTILTVASNNNIPIPTLCHDDRVTPQGACGLCVVEAEGVPKLLRACATLIAPGMIINTQSPRVRASRKTALELLLSTHTGDCRPPCMLACPAQTDCQAYVGLIANGQYREAAKRMKDAHPLPASIGRVCPHPCEKECRRMLADEPVSIAALKYFAADVDLAGEPYLPELHPDTGKKVAIVGGGPAGLTAAYFLKRAGHHVVLYEKMLEMGGLLRYGIPEYRLPKSVLNKELAMLTRMGIVFCNNIALGRDITMDFLRDKYDAVVIASGAGISKKMNCPGEELYGVVGGIDFLRDVALKKPVLLGKRVVVVGGSNTAIDAARTAVRLGVPEVTIVYRRSRDEMPAEPDEIKEAEEEGVIFKFLTNPIEILSRDGQAAQVRLQKMSLGEPDEGGRRSPVAIQGADEIIDADTVIAAIGQEVNRTGMETLLVTRRGAVAVDEIAYRTCMEGVYAIGDVTGRSAYAIEAIGHARKAAAAVHAYVMGKGSPPLFDELDDVPAVIVKDIKTKDDFNNEPVLPRETVASLSIIEARSSFDEIKQGFTSEQAVREANRCLSCGCGGYYECKLLRYVNEYRANTNPYGEKPEKPKHTPDNDNPFFYRNPDKCILCGLCVRVCDEVMGRTALGVMGRGFASEVSTAFGASDCNLCGQCVALCPTGALQEKLPLQKTVPVREDVTETVCAFCSVGCLTRLTAKGNHLLRSLPADDSQSVLCAKGRFGFGQLNQLNQNGKRLIHPLRRVNGSFIETSWAAALSVVRERFTVIAATYGADAIGVAISDHYTVEDMYAAQSYAKTIGTPHIFSFNGVKSGLAEVIGHDASTNRFEELYGTDVIILMEKDIADSHTIASLHIKKAVENGAKLIVINDGHTQADDWAMLKIKTGGDLSCLRQLLTSVANKLPKHRQTEGYDALCEYLLKYEPSTEIPAEIRQAADLYVNAKHAMIVFDQFALSVSASYLIAAMAVLAGQIGRPRAGIIQLKPNNNSQGLSELKIHTDAPMYESLIADGLLRGLLIMGEDVPHIDVSKLDFLAVCDLTLTETAEKANVVLPASAFAECSGHYIDTVRVIKPVKAALPPVAGLTNRQIFEALADKEIPLILPENEAGVFPEGYARLQVPFEDKLYTERINTNRLHRNITNFLKGN